MRALTYFWLMCGLALAAATATATEVKAPVVNKAAPARTSWHDPLSPIARDFLRQRMVGHAVAMNLLVAEVLLLRYDDASDSATLFVEEPAWATPDSAEPGDLVAELPPDFLAHEHRLRRDAGLLRDAAATHRSDALAVAFGQLARSCVACHAVYLPPTR